jgi:DNA-binding response OmpR family regulator
MARILILEHDQRLRAWFARELESDGHEVFQAAGAAEAREELDSSCLDFVVMDVTRRPLDKARDLMQILIRDSRAHLITDVGRVLLKRRIRELLAPSKPPVQGAAVFG